VIVGDFAWLAGLLLGLGLGIWVEREAARRRQGHAHNWDRDRMLDRTWVGLGLCRVGAWRCTDCGAAPDAETRATLDAAERKLHGVAS